MKKTLFFIGILFTSNLGRSQDAFSLVEAMEYAVNNHSAMAVAEMKGDDAHLQYREALAIGMPKVTSNIGYSYFYKRPINPVPDFITPAIYSVLVEEGLTGPFTGQPEFFELGFIRRNQFSAGISAEAIVFDGNYLKGLKVAKKFIQLTRDQIILTEQEVRQNVARAYQNVLVTERNIAIIDNNIRNVENSLQEAIAIYESGFIEELDVDRLRLSLENLRIERDKLTQLIDINYNVLKYEMAFPLGNQMRVSDSLEETVNTMLLSPLEDDGSIDYSKRPEHFLLQEAIELDQMDLARIKMGYYPSITANIGYEQTLQRDKFFDGNEAGFLPNGSIGLKARIPIYDGGDTKSKIQRKKIQLSQREIELQEFERGMELQIRNARTSFQNAKWAVESSQRTLALNEKIYDKTQIKYREGVGSSLEVSQAEASLYQAQATYINALYDLLVAHTELDIATGELLKLQKQ